MTDIEIIKLVDCPNLRYQFEDEVCVALWLTNNADPFYGVIRHHSDKKKLLNLIGKLKGLRFLDLRKNRLNELPTLHFNNLQHLELGSNYLGKVPDWIRNLTTLEYLGLGVNCLDSVPDWLTELKSLKTLKLHKNKLRSLPDLSGLPLEGLNLYFNNMQLPSWLWQLKNMKHFSWGGMFGTRELPEEIGLWNKLEWLSFVATKIDRLPDSFCNLINLKGTRLHKNRLNELPRDIGNLQNLEQLTLFQNNLTSLPDSFYSLRLQKLNLDQNPLDNSSKERVFKMGCEWVTAT